MPTAIDLFAGLGGWSTGARAAGVQVLWAANHWPEAVKWHAANHQDTDHVCQDLHQANWAAVPRSDIGIASPVVSRSDNNAMFEMDFELRDIARRIRKQYSE